MSRKRNRHHSLTSVLNKDCLSSPKTNKPIFGVSTAKSFYIPNHSSILNQQNKIDFTTYKREKALNKKVSFFRDIAGQDDPGMLHFMSSLRQNRTLDNSQRQRMTSSQPFSVAMKQTMNQTLRKKIFESSAKQSRVSTAYYRWHNKSGKGTTTCVDFECSLRDYGTGVNPEEGRFVNTIRPIKYEEVEPRMYDEEEIVCPRQRKLFKMKAR